jgi:hypothetical protein
MHPAPQKELFVRPTPSPGTVFVNDRVSVQTEEKQRVVFVQGVVFSHYSIDDRSAEAYAMVQLFDMQIRTTSHAASATQPERFDATRNA